MTVVGGDDAEFLEYCHLVRDAFVHCPDGHDVPPVPEKLKERAIAFTQAYGKSQGTDNNTFQKGTAQEFKARLYVCTELAEWMYGQTRILHSNIVLDQRRIDERGAEQEFPIAYYTHDCAPSLIPRLASSLGFPKKNEGNKFIFPEFFPNTRCDGELLLDDHFAHAYLFILEGLGGVSELYPNLSEVVCAYKSYWDTNDRSHLLKKVLGIAAIKGGKNVFGCEPIKTLDRITLSQSAGDSKRRKLYFSLIYAFDQWINVLGRWWEGTDWKFEEWSKHTSFINREPGIVFLEEAEILMELLRFYSHSLGGDCTQNLEQLAELFWVAKKSDETWQLTDRGGKLLEWAKKSGICQCNCIDQLFACIKQPSSGGNEVAQLIAKSPLIIPIHALLMALPPPTGSYRCEIAFPAIIDADEHAVVKSAWCFASVNLPEWTTELGKALLSKIVGKQKMLVSLMLDPVTRESFKDAYRDTIIRHGHRSAVAAIMSRNMSHNIGSHVLAQIDKEAMGKTDELKKLHAYLQRRMDLVARITSRFPDWSEPLWFFGDLLRGFLDQTILLNSLIKDQGGWCKEKIEFWIKQDNAVPIKIAFGSSGWTEGLDNALGVAGSNSKSLKDFLVAIPDSTIGAQAFYVFLESLMRNSAKYGESREWGNVLKMHIDISEKDGCYEIAIWDTFSSCQDKLCSEMQEKIKEQLTDNKGGLSAKSLGIAEMREACGFLIHPYGEDYPVYPSLKSDQNYGCESENCECREVSNNHDGKRFPLWVECTKPNGSEKKYLRFKLHLAKPKMVGIVGYSYDLVPEADKLGIDKLAARDGLIEVKGAYQFAIIIDNNKSTDLVEWIKRNLAYLPQRLLLVTQNMEAANGIGRRAVCCLEEELKLYSIRGGGCSNYENKKNCEIFIRSIYEIWIAKHWPKDLANGIKLNIRLDRSQATHNWELLEQSEIFPLTAELALYKKSNDDSVREGTPFYKRSARQNNGGSSLVIDYANHDDWDELNETKLLVIFGNGDNTFETLFTPPASQLALDYLLLGLIEAALTKVVILDERVAAWPLEAGGEVEYNLKKCQQARIWPVYKINEYWLTPYLQELCTTGEEGNTLEEILHLPVWEQNSTGAPKIHGVAERDSSTPFPQIDVADFVVVHIGIAETIGKISSGDSRQFMLNGYDVAPAVVMTSGRGGTVNQRVGEDLPFIEFAAIKGNFTVNVGKYHLVRALMSTKATKKQE